MKWIIYPVVVVMLVIAVGAGTVGMTAARFRKSDTIAANVTIAGVEVERLTKAQAHEKLAAEWLPTLPQTLTVLAGGESHELSAEKLGRKPMLDEAVQQAWRVGREGGVIKQTLGFVRAMRAPLDIPVQITVDQPSLTDQLQALAKIVDREPVDASVTVTGGDDVSVIPGKVGLKLDRQAAAKTMTDALVALEAVAVKLPCKEAQPRVSARDLAHLEVVLGSYSTRYSAGKVDRTHNLLLAVQAINKTVIMPGEVFSADRAIGPRIAARGFREAPIFQDGEVTPATGGGICQIATTIYNAALFAGLQMVERHHHSQPVTYAPAGRDATVYAGRLDMRFRNNTPHPILMLASLSGSQVHVRLIGKREDNKKVRLESSSVTKIAHEKKEIPDPNLEVGKREVEKKGRDGIRVTVYRIIANPDGEEQRETLHTDVYRAQAEVVRVGTKPAFYKDKAGKPVLDAQGKPVPIALGPDGKPVPYKPPTVKPPAKPAGKPASTVPAKPPARKPAAH